jgi:hypothetical protein
MYCISVASTTKIDRTEKLGITLPKSLLYKIDKLSYNVDSMTINSN